MNPSDINGGNYSYPSNNDERTWGMLCHLMVFSGYLIPLGNIIGPLVVWLVKRDEYPFVADQGKEVLNFQISIVIYIIGALLLMVILIGIPLLVGLGVFNLVITIIGSVKAYEGKYFRYPLSIKFIN